MDFPLVRMIRLIWLVAPLLVVPLGLRLLVAQLPGHPLLSRLRTRALLSGGIAAAGVVADQLGIGVVPLFGAVSWLAFTILLAGSTLADQPPLWRRPLAGIAPFAALTVARLYVAVGGVWLLLAMVRWNPFGFEEPIVTLTAMHFHFAGFAGLVIVGAWGRTRRSRIYPLVVSGGVAGPALVALGITYSRPLELVGVIVFAGSLLVFAVVWLAQIASFSRGAPRALAGIAGVSLLASMVLAFWYALGPELGIAPITIPAMVPTHGLVNALGFAACGLAALILDGRGDGTRSTLSVT
jgi:hypothetical protein